MNIRDMHFNDWHIYATDSILKGNACVSVSTCIENYAVPLAAIGWEAHLMNFIYEFTFNIGLIISELNVRVALAKFIIIVLKTSGTVNARLTLTQEI